MATKSIPAESQSLRQLSKAIAERIFTDGAMRKATRLALEYDGRQDGDGWCEGAIADQIYAGLDHALTAGLISLPR